MSPIYIRPAREQAEHDRLIVFLEAKFGKKFEVLINKGEARDYALKVGTGTFFPDLILQDAKKPAGVIEVETGESTNNLEALAQWVHFGKSKFPFQLYVPVLAYDAARRFCEMHSVAVSEIWTYRPLFDGFDLVRVFHDPSGVSKAGKGPAAKVVVMPKVADAPKPQPAIEAVEEILARIGSREAAKAAAREAAKAAGKSRPSKVITTMTGPPKVDVKPPAKADPKAAAKAAAQPAAKPAPAPAAKPEKKAPVKPAKPAKAVKVAKAAKAAKPAKPAKAAKASKPVKASKKPAKPTKPVKKAKAGAVSKSKPKPKAKPVKPKKR